MRDLAPLDGRSAPMLQQYKKTFARIQIAIAMAAVAVHLSMGHRWFVTAIFLAVMQLGAVAGAWWGQRLKRRLEPQY
jgi:uncharacterized membrane protein YfcA